MFKKVLVLLLVIAPLSTFAQDKFAFINYQELLSKMPEVKDYESKMVAKQDLIKKTAEGIEAEFNEKVKQFSQTPTDSITESIAVDRQKQLEQLRQRYEDYMQSSQAELQKEQEKLLTPIHQKLQTAIKEVGDAQGYTYIMERSSLLYAGSNAVDAGKQVKSKLGIVD